jgi:hypothetical protein
VESPGSSSWGVSYRLAKLEASITKHTKGTIRPEVRPPRLGMSRPGDSSPGRSFVESVKSVAEGSGLVNPRNLRNPGLLKNPVSLGPRRLKTVRGGAAHRLETLLDREDDFFNSPHLRLGLLRF